MHRMPDPLDFLADGVPLSLLIDLLDERGPNSRRLYGEEQGDTSWLNPAFKRSA
jgi:hypothetical protein